MADYHSPTVVTPDLPITDMTPLERLLLGLLFDAEQGDDAIYFHSWCGPSDTVTLPVKELRAAREESRHIAGSAIAARVDVLLAEFDAASEDPGDHIDVDITRPDTGWDRMFQDIVRRSATIDEVVVTAAFTCSKMRPDGFGGSVMRITSDAIQYDRHAGKDVEHTGILTCTKYRRSRNPRAAGRHRIECRLGQLHPDAAGCPMGG